MRILAVSLTLRELHGRFVHEKLVALAGRGHDVHVIAEREGASEGWSRGDGDDRLTVHSIPVSAVATWPGPALLPALAAAVARDSVFVRRLLRAVRSRHRGSERWVQLGRMLPFAGLDPDVVHFEWAHEAAGFLEVIRLLPAPTVVSCRGSDLRILPLQSPRLRQSLPLLFDAVDAVHCVSQELADQAVAYGARAEQIFVAPSGVDTGFFATRRANTRADDGVIRILSAGRLHWVKGLRYALQAVKRLRTRGHPVLYTIAGGEDGGGDEVRFTIRDLGLDGVVTVAGQLQAPALGAALAETDVFLLTSVSEGVSVATMQAMAAGVPVVVTDVGGMRATVADGEHGYVVAPRDPDALADAVERLIVDPEARRAAGRRAADHARRRFDLNLQVDSLVAVYEDLVRQARPGPRTVRMPSGVG